MERRGETREGWQICLQGQDCTSLSLLPAAVSLARSFLSLTFPLRPKKTRQLTAAGLVLLQIAYLATLIIDGGSITDLSIQFGVLALIGFVRPLPRRRARSPISGCWGGESC